MSINFDNELIQNFFGEIYRSVSKRIPEEKRFDNYVFTEVINLSFFCSGKIFSVLKNNNTNYITEKDFTEGLFILYFGENNKIIDLLFSILDFDNDKIINIEDVKIFFIHLYSSSNLNIKEDKLYKVIEYFFNDNNNYSFNDFKNKCLSSNPNLISLFKYLIHINKFFNYKQLDFYQKIKYPNKKSLYSDYLQYESNFHLDNIILQNEDFILNKEENENELNELMNFENDIHNTMEEMDNEKISYSKNLKFKTNYNLNEKQFLKCFFKSRSKILIEKSPNKFLKNKTTYDNNNEFIFYQRINNQLIKVKLTIIYNMIFYFLFKNDVPFFMNIIYLNKVFLLIKGSEKIENKLYFIVDLISNIYGNLFFIEFLNDDIIIIKKFKKIYFNQNPIHILSEDYSIEKEEIGKGKYGVCKKCYKKNSDKIYCIKIIKKYNNKQGKNNYKIIIQEKSIFKFLQKFPHENIIQCIDIYEDYKHLYLIYEYIPFELKQIYISSSIENEKVNYTYKIINICFGILNGLNHLHSYNIIHRDIKNSNILVNENYTPKIIDFGFSKVYGKNEMASFKCGSLFFQAPEIISGQLNNNKVDIWATGITLYFLLYGIVPFYDQYTQNVKDKICNSVPNFFRNDNNVLHNNMILIDIIKDCLIKNYNKRPCAMDLITKYFNLYCNYK